MIASTPAIILDTCAAIWLVNGDPIAPAALSAIKQSMVDDRLTISPITAWEIGLISKRRTSSANIDFRPDPMTWYRAMIQKCQLSELPLTGDIALASTSLPEPIHGDPADRMIIATARHYNCSIITRDSRIVEYAKAGYVDAIPC